MRTPRELLVIATGVGLCAHAYRVGDHSWNLYAYAAPTLLFAARFYAARVLFLSMCIGALALRIADLARPEITFTAQAPVYLGILALALVLCGSDLVRRFDDEGRGVGPFRNFWRELSPRQRRHVAWSMHLVGALAALGHHMWIAIDPAPVPPFLYAIVVAAAVIGGLYLAGRGIAAPATALLGGVTAWQVATTPGLPAHMVPVALVTAVAATLVALPWTLRWLRLR